MPKIRKFHQFMLLHPLKISRIFALDFVNKTNEVDLMIFVIPSANSPNE
jgi:hypothetical protein